MTDWNYPKQLEIFEVGPRDGLQNEKKFVPTESKLELIEKLIDAGCQKIELTSFVSPKWVPQMKDAKEVVAAIGERKGILLNALIPNMKGLELAIESGLKEVITIMSSSESHNKKNLNMPMADSLAQIKEINRKAAEAGLRVRSYIATSFGCPMEGAIPVETLVNIARELESYGSYEISLGDPTGMASPASSYEVCKAVKSALSEASVAAHFHRANGIEFANILAAMQAGITVIDGSVGGLGGCPFAPGATGNTATETIVDMFHRMGIETGIDAEKITECGVFARSLV